MDRAKQFVNNFTKAIDQLEQHSPNELSFCVVVYARDLNNKDKEQPDGKMAFEGYFNGTYYDSATIREYVNNYMNQVHLQNNGD